MSAADRSPRAGHVALHPTAPEVGFVGTTAGMTGAQLRSVQIALLEYGPVELHLAGRRGADEQVCKLADRLRLWRVVHPGITPDEPPACAWDLQFPARPEDERYANIVKAVGVLLAAPRNASSVPGCRTWWVVHHAHEVGRPVVLVMPDGSTTRSGGRAGS